MRAVFRQVRARPRTSPHTVVQRPLLRPFTTTRPSLAAAPQPDADAAGSGAKQDGDNGGDGGKQKDKKKEEQAPQDTTVAGRSPWQAFVDVLKEEVQKNREWQTNVKALGGEVDKVQDSAAMKRAREAYERARVRVVYHRGPAVVDRADLFRYLQLTASIKENPRLAAAAEELRKAGISVNSAVTHTLQEMGDNAFVRATGRAVSAPT